MDLDKGPQRRRVVITGLGVVCAVAGNASELHAALLAGRTGIRLVEHLATDFYGPVWAGAVDTARFAWLDRLRPASYEQHGLLCELAVRAASEAVHQAQLKADSWEPGRVGIVVGNSGDAALGEEFHTRWIRDGLSAVRKGLIRCLPPCAVGDVLSRRFGFHGPRCTISTSSASGANALAYGLELIRAGKADIVLVGGSNSLSQTALAGFKSAGMLASEGCEPFGERDGLTLGEGAGFIVLENVDTAARRGVPILAEILGYGLSADAYHAFLPDPTGGGTARAIEAALTDAGISGEQVDYIHPHGVGVLVNDLADTKALKTAFKDRAYQIPVSSVKGMIGHCLGASGCITGVVCALAVQRQFVPGTCNLRKPAAGCDLDYVPGKARSHRVSVALGTSWGLAGNNVAILYGRYDPHRIVPPPRAPLGVVITGMGVVSCVGLGKQAFWEAIRTGRGGLGAIRSFDASAYRIGVAGEIDEGNLLPYINPSLYRSLDAVGRYAMAATRMALTDAALDPHRPAVERVGVIFGTSTGPVGTVSAFQRRIVEQGAGAAQPSKFTNTLFNAAAGHISTEFGFKGCAATLASGDVSGLAAVAYAAELLQRGALDIAVAVTADELNEPLLAAFSRLGLLSRRACRPLDVGSDGITLSSGGTAFVLETAAGAQARGAHVCGRFLGYGLGADACLPGVAHADAEQWGRTMTETVQSAQDGPPRIDYVAAAACGMPKADRAEIHAIKRALGEQAAKTHVSAVRSMVGHAGASGPALCMVAALMAMDEGLVPPTLGLEDAEADVVPLLLSNQPVRARMEHALVNAFACGGSYASVVLGRGAGNLPGTS